MLARYCFCFVALTALCLAGCETTSVAVVVQSDTMTRQDQDIAPTIPVQLKDGKTTTLAEIAAPICMIAFVEAPAGQIDYINPDVFAAARQTEPETISVVQITVPAEGQTFPDNALNQCSPPNDDNMILVLDPNRSAWDMFQNPPAGTLLLIDPKGYVIEKSTLSKTKDIQFKAFEIAKTQDEEQFEESFGDDD